MTKSTQIIMWSGLSDGSNTNEQESVQPETRNNPKRTGLQASESGSESKSWKADIRLWVIEKLDLRSSGTSVPPEYSLL